MRGILALALILSIAGCDARQSSDDAYTDVVYENLSDSDAAASDNVTANAVDEALADTVDSADGDDSNMANAGDPGVPPPLPPGVQRGVGTFIEPEDMEIGSWHVLEFIVAPDEIKARAEAEQRPTTGPTPIIIAERMRVDLLPDRNFEIVRKTDAVQSLGLDKSASWQWDLSPKTRDGTFTLHAKVEVLRGDKVIEAYTRRVSVRVEVGTWESFLQALRNAASLGEVLETLFRAWERTLLALAGLIAAAGIVWWRLGLRKSRPED